MAQFYTLEEAAQRLGMPPEEFRRRLKTEPSFTAIRPFRDGPTLRFRSADIDELARSYGAASDPGLQPGPLGASPLEADDLVFLPASGKSRTPSAPSPLQDDEPPMVNVDDSIFTAPSTRSKSDSDSDVRLDMSALSSPPSDPSLVQPTEEITLDIAGPGSALIKSSGLSGKKLGGPGSSKIPLAAPPSANDSKDGSSEFELDLDPENDSFEFQLSSDSSDEVDLGGLDLAPDPKKGGQSGINLGKPADSGVSLEGRGKSGKTGPIPRPGAAADAGSEDDFELSLDPGPASQRLASPTSGANRAVGPDSDSEFELSLDADSGSAEALAGSSEQADIFETDFDIPSLEDDSGAEIAAVTGDDLSEEFEVDLPEMESVVEVEADEVDLVDDGAVLTDDDEEPAPAPKSRRSAPARSRKPAAALDDDLDDLDESPSASGALRGVRDDDDDDYDTRPAAAGKPVEVVPASWGALPGVVLMLTLPLLFIGTLMSYETIQSMWGYHQSTPAGGMLVRGISGELGYKTGD